FPMSAMIFTADEVASGEINHAIRFILPNNRIRHGEYTHPGTHSTPPCSGGPDAPPYGVHFRLSKDFDMSKLPSEGARVVARALQKYGMFLSDGGQIALTAASDRFTDHKWSDVNIDGGALSAIKVKDFEVVGLQETIKYTGDCVRN